MSASYTIITALYDLNVKNSSERYYKTLSNNIRRLYPMIEDDQPEYLFFGNTRTWHRFENIRPDIAKHFRPEIIELDDLPATKACTGKCRLKLGGPKTGEIISKLNRIWCNKIWFMKHAASLVDTDNIIWIDAGMRWGCMSNFPEGYSFTKKIAENVLCTRRYGFDPVGVELSIETPPKQALPTKWHRRPYRIKHVDNPTPHFIHAAVMGGRRESLHHIYEKFREAETEFSQKYHDWDEETILSHMYIHTPELFATWRQHSGLPPGYPNGRPSWYRP